MGSCSDGVPGKLIVDTLHGDVHLNDREWRILDTVSFQRLRRIKQLQMGQVTYPSATHTRFVHCLGTLAIMARILRLIQAGGKVALDDRQRENLRLAALLHDLGHYPYSHLMEGVDRVKLTEEIVADRAGKPLNASRSGYPDHVQVGKTIVTSQPEILDALGDRDRAQEVADLFSRSKAADPQLSKLLHSSFDMDRVDFLLRDSRAAGIPYGNIDVNYLLNSLKISETGMLGVEHKALPAAEQFLLARFFMYKAVYYHRTTYGIEEACKQLLRRIRDEGLFDMPQTGEEVLRIVSSSDLAGFTDEYVDRLVQRASQGSDDVMRALARCIQNRRPPKLLGEIQILEDSRHQAHNKGTAFWLQAKSSLKRIAEKYEIPLGQFLLCRTKPLHLEQRGAFLAAEEAKGLPSEQEDELIKVFVGDEAEPKSLVDIPHSVISLCAGHFWQAFRLYVVLEDDPDGDLVGHLRSEVRAWGS